MMILILFDVFNKKINICHFLICCSKVEIFSLIFLMTLFVLLLIMINKENMINKIWVNESFELIMFQRIANAFNLFVKLLRLNLYNNKYNQELNAFNNIRMWDCVRTCDKCCYINAQSSLKELLCKIVFFKNIKS